jgi:ATP-dependent Clp protease ATP-binding subunit ClpC
MSDNFSDRVKKILQLSREAALDLGNDYIGTEHIVIAFLGEGGGEGVSILKELGVDTDALKKKIQTSLATGGEATLSASTPFTPGSKKMLAAAAMESKKRGSKVTNSEHLLLAFFSDASSPAHASLTAEGITYDAVLEILDAKESGTFSSASVKGSEKDKKSKTPFLDHFARDLTALAMAGQIDPIIGREEEIRRTIQILARKKKNNPVLLGEPGVGKTAIAEGLALMIVNKRVPTIIENKRVCSLDVAGLVAGTKFRGQFEERIKALLAEVQKNKDVILFIDEIHTLVGAGSSSDGSLDASNMFKPALARGELQCVGATTFDEFKKTIEKDGALERRFQPVTVNPPSIEDTVEILNGVLDKYEDHHGVKYTEEAVIAAVRLSERYITARFLPDKAFDVIDEAGARTKISYASDPEVLTLKSEIADLEVVKADFVAAEQYDAAAAALEQIETRKIKIEDILASKKMGDFIVVDEDIIANTVSQMTGVPVAKSSDEENIKLLSLEETMRKHVVDQESAITAISKAIRRNRAGFHSHKRPIGTFMFLGPTGVGKTELAKCLADQVFGSQDHMVRIDMSEYMEKFNVSRLVGAPPGYVGYEEGGILTEKVRKNPYCVVLLDEIEKAHPDVFNLLLQVFDDGHLTDSNGRKVNFKNTIIIMTSNLGSRDLSKGGIGFSRDTASVEARAKSSVETELKKLFTPEFLNRLDDHIIFQPLTKEALRKIVEIQLAELTKRVQERKIEISFSDSVKDHLVEEAYDPAFGARPLRRKIQNLIEDKIAEEYLRKTFSEEDTIRVEFDGEVRIVKI